MEFEKLYMFNPFEINKVDSSKIAETYTSLQKEIIVDADTGYDIAKNIEIYSNMNYLLGEMIARIQQQYDEKKVETTIKEQRTVYEERKKWLSNDLKEKAPAMSYFEAIAKDAVKEDLKEVAQLYSRLFRFKKAYDSIESKQNALKKKLEAIRYEI